MKYKVLLIDFDGTLSPTHLSILGVLTNVFSRYGLTLPDEQLIKDVLSKGLGINESMNGFLSKTKKQITNDLFSEIVQEYSIEYSESGVKNVSLYQGVFETLTLLKSHGYQLVILSSKPDQRLNAIIDNLKIEHFFDSVIGDDGKTPKKPMNNIFIEKISPRYNQLSASDFLMVGDTNADIGFAKNCNMHCCLVDGYGQNIDPNSSQYSINCFSEINNIL